MELAVTRVMVRYSKPAPTLAEGSLSLKYSNLAVRTRSRASASATRLVSIVTQRRPHFSETAAVVPDRQVGSNTRSPGSVVMRTQRSMIFGFVSTTYCFFRSVNPATLVSVQMFVRRIAPKSSAYLMYRKVLPTTANRLSCANPAIPSSRIFHWEFGPG